MAEKILIVDDDVDSLKLISLMLKRQGYEVAVAESGGKALQSATSEAPNLIILDVMMPDMNGLDVCRHLRADPETADIPIIMFTAKTLIDDKVKGFEAGADDYLTKPTHPAELANRVKSVLQRKTTTDRAQAPTQPSKITKITSPPPAATKAGKLIGILGVKGGVGTTTVAVNVAAALLSSSKDPVLADLRLGVGGMGAMLSADSYGMTNLLKEQSITPESVSASFASHESGLKALVTSTNPLDVTIEFNSEKPLQIVQLMRRFGDPALIDLGSGLKRESIPILENVDRLLFVIEASAVALGMARSQLEALDEMVGNTNINVVVVNRSPATLPWHEAENHLNREVKAIISPAPELAFQAGEQGKPMVLLQPTAIVSGQFMKLAEDLK